MPGHVIVQYFAISHLAVPLLRARASCEIGETVSEAALEHSAQEHLWPGTAPAENTGMGARETAAALSFLFL